MKRSLLIVAIVGLLISLGLGSSRLSAGNPDEFEVVIPAQTLEYPVELPAQPDVKTLGAFVGKLTVFVGAQQCLVVDLANPANRNADGDIVIVVGAPGQPAGCSANGARVSFKNAQGGRLVVEFVFQAGARGTLSNLAPEAPSSGGSLQSPSTGDGGLAIP